MKRRVTVSFAFAIMTGMLATAHADEVKCRKTGGTKVASLYQKIAKSYGTCSRKIAGGKTCDQAVRDAKAAVALSKARAVVLGACDMTTAIALGFTGNGPLSVRLPGVAAGEGRQVADGVFGRDATAMSDTLIKCAKTLVNASAKAGAFQVKTLSPCGASCDAGTIAKVDAAFTKATNSANKGCAPADVMTLVGTNLATYLAGVRTGAQRVVNAFHPGFNPALSVVSPTPSTILTPGSLPTSVEIESLVAGISMIPGYVIDVRVAGLVATFDPASKHFKRMISVPTPAVPVLKATVPVFLTAHTTLGTVSTTANLHFNLASLAPSVVINGPTTGTITPAGSITVSGQVLGNLPEADVLTVAGNSVGFNPSTGAFSTSVTLAQEVNVIQATVQSIGLGTTDTDSVVVLKGNALGLGSRVPMGLFNRLNNTGFAHIKSVIEADLDPAFSPSNFVGRHFGGTCSSCGGADCGFDSDCPSCSCTGGHVVLGFSTGTKSADVAASGAHTIMTTISINNFHLDVDVGSGCTAHYDAGNITINAPADLVSNAGNLGALVDPMNVQVVFTSDGASVSGGFLCSLGSFFTDVRGQIRAALQSGIAGSMQGAFSGALAGINVGGPIGMGLDATIDSIYDDIVEDSQGVTFLVDSNITANSPVPDAPPITQTLDPTPAGPPVLTPTIPATSTPYDLGFCLTDAFVNRAMAAFMLQGQFNQSLMSVPFGGSTVALNTTVISALLGDTTYNTACPGCPVTLVLKPTAAAVARGPLPAEDGTVILTIPNYRIDAVADDSGTPMALISGNVTFELPVTLAVSGSQIAPTVGALNLLDVKVTDNPIGANPTKFANGVATLFPLAAQSLGSLFGAIPLPSFSGLTLTGVGSGYNVSCAAIYLNL
jgi:hypothetical protein